MEEELRKKNRNPRDKKNVNKISDEDKDKKRLSKEFKKIKQQVLEDEDDWTYWQQYYK